MKKSASSSPFHARNRHQGEYDFAALTAAHPPLAAKVRPNGYGVDSIDFADPDAVMLLNQALIKLFYGIDWQLAPGSLCPPVPGRADYLHYLADLLALDNHGAIPTVDVLDIGCGANCIYPLIGAAEYGWRFTGTEIDEAAIKAANRIVAANPGLARQIRLRRQKNSDAVLAGVVSKNEFFHAVMCNPPFHASAEEAAAGSQRKVRNLGLDKAAPLNFGGQHNELWCVGGEKAFVGKMIGESVALGRQVVWFTSLVSRKENLATLEKQLRALDVAEVRVVNMAQGQKQSRFLAWSFMPAAQRSKVLSR
ncbi:23S rRNA (adenine1618-N6)-methyltransferase [Pantoea sp. AN62]|jgi:23S rRNA (adenine1618-N6)-methyltransferase|uniref:Ribosomal RNA large subunit methyltransferase F n=1 Tax=Pantoea brenneri TaxID=472694 RepID=A0ABU9MJL6_9GAMM|nr:MULTISPECIES: 23S rRNA (adenine(1618)-N(6))-methyltransferase RlmF [Pantoea]KKD33855.1 23S rRNA methyltransferase [Pantoea sp. 3.5.1]MDH1085048.1 23S rRNA (adenine(1618)-N(6))-methyltransferase RlmF [Pantoea brenneri]MDU4125787.1 23S rRNA (adenine(1618)-N(6))-methyltransferase RlmF [Pantoea sp.]MDU4744771.1 23S rRNA (adenine(1618)-N(6))-methyltransferase RlmF [Pantoea sp.]ORM59512.1 23S rRNA (adenine(1618)-N(6))-methyltransferase [Pantoea brenneri]